MFQERVKVYTDGGCNIRRGRVGAWAYVVVGLDPNPIYRSGGTLDTTNNRMEIQAVLEALKDFGPRSKLTIFSDSQYVVNGTTAWLPGWRANGWLTSTGKPVKNLDLWESLDELYRRHQPVLRWVKGHSVSTYNNMADELCTAEMKKLYREHAL